MTKQGKLRMYLNQMLLKHRKLRSDQNLSSLDNVAMEEEAEESSETEASQD